MTNVKNKGIKNKNKKLFDITIITPTLNAEQYIEQCLMSISHQKGVNVQHIVVDGGSTDGTLNKVRQKGVPVLVLPNSSIYEALNKGIEYAEAQLLGFINADDIYASDYALAKVVETYHKAGRNGIIYGNCIFIDPNGKELYRLIPAQKLTHTISSLRVFNISHPAWYIKKKCMAELGYYNTSLRYVSDCDLIIRALEKNVCFTYVDFEFAKFKLHSGNASRSTSAKKEQFEYFHKLHGRSIFKKIIHLILLVHLYSRDLRYFKYRLFRFIR